MSLAATMTPEPARLPKGPLATEFSATRVVCANCTTENGPRQQFCSSCGGQLWEKCPKCEALNPASGKYCGVCGADLAALLLEFTDKIQAALEDALALRKGLEFSKAIARLKGLSLFEHSRLKALTGQVRNLVEELVAERERCRVALETVLTKSKKLESDGQDQQAFEMLQRVPAPLRTPEVHQLLELLRGRLRGVQDLEAEIRSLLRAKDYLHVVGPLRHFLSLRPDHAAGLQIASMLRNHFLAAARGKVAEQQYEEGLQLLDLILPCVRDEEVEKYIANVREVCWLIRHLQSAPIIDRTLADLAARLPKMIPDDAEAVRLCTTIHEQYRAAAPRSRGRDIVTEASRKKSILGGGVSRLQVPRNMVVDDPVVRARLELDPGCFPVALGLALQGLGFGRLETNLVFREGTGILSRLSLPLRKRAVEASWGFDFGESSVKVVRIVKHDELRARLTLCDVVRYREPIIRSDAIGEKNDILQEAVDRFLTKHAIGGNEALCASLMSKEVLTKSFQVPFMKSRKLSDMMRYEVQHQVPIPLEELNWDFAICSGDHEGANEPFQQMMLLVAKMLEIRGRMRVFENSGHDVDILQAEPAALHNFVLYENQLASADKSACTTDLCGYVDIGLRTTTLVLSAPELLWSRSLPMGGNDFTEAIGREFAIFATQAEKLKREPQLAKRLSRLFDPIRSVAERLVDGLQRSLQAFKQDRPFQAIEHFFLLGGGARLHGLLWYLLDESRGSRVGIINDDD
jgi:type IV pilus assembly protein PilM